MVERREERTQRASRKHRGTSHDAILSAMFHVEQWRLCRALYVVAGQALTSLQCDTKMCHICVETFRGEVRDESQKGNGTRTGQCSRSRANAGPVARL